MTFVLVGLRRSGNFSPRKEHIRNVKDHALQALFPLRPARELLLKFRSLGLPPLLFPALQGGRRRGGGGGGGGAQGAPGVVSREASSPPARPRSSERGGGVALDIRPLRASAPLFLQPLRELGRERLLNRSGLPLPALLPRLLLPAHHSTLGDVMSREKFRRTAPLLDPPVFPDLRIEEQGRIVELALGRTALVTMAVVLALTPLTVRGQAVESVEGGHPLGHCPPASGHDLRIASALCACALVLGETALDVTSRGLLTATYRVDSVRVPQLAEELAVTRSPSSVSWTIPSLL